MVFYHILAAALGACLSSFCVTLGFRWAHPHYRCRWSVCPHCCHRLSWWQLIPIFGWLLQAGKCINCRHQIDRFSTCCELATACLFVFSNGQSLVNLIHLVIITTCLLIMSATDWYAQWICPWLLVGLVPLRYFIIQQPFQVTTAVMILILSSILALAVGNHYLGAGDAEFLIVLIIVSGIFATAIVLLVGCLTLLSWLMFHHRSKQQLAFVPWLSLGVVVLLVLAK